jgi:hypothetical protein
LKEDDGDSCEGASGSMLFFAAPFYYLVVGNYGSFNEIA